MIIPPEKKSTFYLFLVLALAVGLAAGALLALYGAYKNQDAFCAIGQPLTAQDVLSAVPPEQLHAAIQKATTLDTNNTVFGIVSSKGANGFSISIEITDPQGATATTTEVAVPFDPAKDQVVVSKQSGASSAVETSTVAFSDLKVGAPVMIVVVDGKKTIYLLTSTP